MQTSGQLDRQLRIIMRQPLREVLEDSDRVLVMDGGQGTELENRGTNISGPVWSTVPFTKEEFWNFNHHYADREIVNSMFKAYMEAGAQLLSTVTYQTSYKTICTYTDISSRTQYDQLLDKIVGFCRRCIGDDHYLVGSIGPYAALVGAEYTGDYGPEPNKIDYWQYFEPQVANFNRNDAIDIIGFETIPNVHELKSILSWDETKVSKPFYVSLCVGDDGNLRDGTPLDQLLSLFENRSNKNLLLVGINCCSLSISSHALARLSKVLASTPMGLLVYPNSGEIYNHKTQTWAKPTELDSHESSWPSLVKEYRKFGVRAIGGCCRTSPGDIQEIRKAVEAL